MRYLFFLVIVVVFTSCGLNKIRLVKQEKSSNAIENSRTPLQKLSSIDKPQKISCSYEAEKATTQSEVKHRKDKLTLDSRVRPTAKSFINRSKSIKDNYNTKRIADNVEPPDTEEKREGYVVRSIFGYLLVTAGISLAAVLIFGVIGTGSWLVFLALLIGLVFSITGILLLKSRTNSSYDTAFYIMLVLVALTTIFLFSL